MKLQILAVALISALFWSYPARGQSAPQTRSDDSADESPTCDDEKVADFALHADRRGLESVFVAVCFDPSKESEVREKLPEATGCEEREIDVKGFRSEGLLGVEAICERHAIRHGIHFSGQVDLVPLQELLKNTSDRFLRVTLDIPPYGDVSCMPNFENPKPIEESVKCTYVLADDTEAPRVIQYKFGYRTAEVARIGGILGFLLLVPIATTIWLRRRALSAREEERTTVWFAYFRFLRLTTIAGTLVWWSAADLLHADAFLEFLIPEVLGTDLGIKWILPWILLWVPPVVVYAVCVVLSSPIHQLRGVQRTRIETISQTLWAIGRIFIPISLIVLAMGEIFESPKTAVLLFAAGILAARLGAKKLAQASGMELNALSSGALRDRTFALAEKAKAKLYQLYVLPTERIRMANAFAHIGHNIYLTDYLLRNLSKREIDAVVGHEVSHLQLKHLRQRWIVMFIGFVAMGIVGVWLEPRIPERFPTGPVFYACLLLVIFFITRRNEFSADAGAVKLTGDAEAMITALAKLARLNTMPMNWGKVEGKMLTHPSISRRIARIAQASGIAEERIPELLRESTGPPTDTYTIPRTALREGKVFSTLYKAGIAWRLSWAILLAGTITPALIALIVQHAQLRDTEAWLAYGGGLALTVGVCLTLANLLPMRGQEKLEKTLRDKFAADGMPQGESREVFVNLAPDSEPRIYEGNWSWDAGFLSATAETVCYRGEEARFFLNRDEISSVSLGPGPLSWFKTAAAYIRWFDSSGRERVLNFRVARARSLRDMTRSTVLFARDLDNWRRGLPLASDAILHVASTASRPGSMLGPPNIGTVTSIAPRDLARGRFLVREIYVNTILAMAVAIVAGLPVPLFGSTSASSAGALYVLGVAWLTRVILLEPYWRGPEIRINSRATSRSEARSQTD
jgi:Zn-dependent protease with chaperone function